LDLWGRKVRNRMLATGLAGRKNWFMSWRWGFSARNYESRSPNGRLILEQPGTAGKLIQVGAIVPNSTAACET
jgi:hypothetical protein